MTPREQLYYNNWLEITDEIREGAFEEGQEKGREEGAHAKAIENARNMLKDAVSEEQVAKWTALPLEQVLALKEELARETAGARS